MSILLDALKRSESQRDLGSVPTLQTSVDSPTRVSQSMPGWLPLVMSLATVGLISWMGLAQFKLPEDWAESRLTAQPGAESAGQQPSQAVNSENEQVVVAGKSILPQLPASAGAQQQQTPPDTQSDNQAGQQRLGRQVRDYAAQQPATPAASQTADPRRENAVRQPELAKVELAREQQNPALARQSPQSDTGSSTQPYEPEIINYWQVPEKMREGLPDLRISVLVYAEAPENRFVLMNGERLREGQELPNGLLLEEILRDRAIFNYRNYRFYLKS